MRFFLQSGLPQLFPETPTSDFRPQQYDHAANQNSPSVKEVQTLVHLPQETMVLPDPRRLQNLHRHCPVLWQLTLRQEIQSPLFLTILKLLLGQNSLF